MIKTIETSLDIYKNVVPIGYPYKSVIETWSFGGTKTELKAEPEPNYVLFVKRVRFAMADDTAISAGSLHLKHSGATSGSPLADVEILDPSDLMTRSKEPLAKVEFPTGTSKYYGIIEFTVPVKCRSSTIQSFSVVDDITVAWTFTAGSIDWIIEGWQILESEYDASV